MFHSHYYCTVHVYVVIHLCVVCGLFPTSYVVCSLLCSWVEVSFVDVSGIVDHHCLNLFFIVYYL